jgi:enoyl-CoA hydratase/carnithine racemase
MNDRVRVTLDDHGVAEVELRRADKLNALDSAMFAALAAALAELGSMPRLRAVVLHGAGKAFCAGLDMASFAGMADGVGVDGVVQDLSPRTHGLANQPQHIALGWRELPVPVIAAVHGVAFGGGLQVALGADIRLVAPGTRMSVMELHWGIVPDMAGMVLTRGLVRDDVLRELTLTARAVEAEEAVRIGLATRVSADPLTEARALAASIAQRHPQAVRAAKRLLNRAIGLGDASAAALLQAESDEQMRLMGTPNQREAVMANLQKRAATYVD